MVLNLLIIVSSYLGNSSEYFLLGKPDCLFSVERQNFLQHTHTLPFNGPFSKTTQVSRYQKGKTNLDFTEATDRVAVASAGPYASLNLAPDKQPHQHPTTLFFTGWMPFLPPNQQRQSTEGKSYKSTKKQYGTDL